MTAGVPFTRTPPPRLHDRRLACAGCSEPIDGDGVVVNDELLVCPECEAALCDPLALLRGLHEAERAEARASQAAARWRREMLRLREEVGRG